MDFRLSGAPHSPWGSPGFTMIHRDSLGTAANHQDSLEAAANHCDSFELRLKSSEYKCNFCYFSFYFKSQEVLIGHLSTTQLSRKVTKKPDTQIHSLPTAPYQ